MTTQGRVPFRRHHTSRRARLPSRALGVHIIAIIRGRFVVFAAGTIAARAVAGVGGGAD